MPMLKKTWRETLAPSSFLAGTIIGAGIFSLPWMVYKSGVIPSIVFGALFCAVAVLVHLMYGDVILNDDENHRFVGVTKNYFGKLGYVFSILSAVLETFLILTIYLVISISFIKLVFPKILDEYSVLIFWAMSSLLVLLKIRKEAIVEFISVLGISIIVLSIGVVGINGIYNKNIPLFGNNIYDLLLPLGIVLFAFSGRAGAASLIYYLKEQRYNEKSMRDSLALGTVFPIIIYIFFVLGVIGISAQDGITEDSISGIVNAMPSWFLYVLAVFGILSLLSSYISVGFDLKKSLHFDLKFSNVSAAVLTIFFPLSFYFLGAKDFIELVSITGGIFVAIEGILISLMWLKLKNDGRNRIIKRIPRALVYLIILMYISIAAYVIYSAIL